MSGIKNVIIIFFAMMLLASYASAEVYIVTNKDVQVSSSDLTDVANIFLGKKSSWDSGESVIPVILKGGQAFDDFIGSVIKRTPAQFSTYWKRKLFTGTGIPPKSFETEQELLAFVAKNKGAVGHVSTQVVDAGVNYIKVQ